MHSNDMTRPYNYKPLPDSSPPRQRITGFGLYVYLLSDAILFAALFATFAVLRHATAGGPGGHELFNLNTAFFETAFLLTSSLTCGLAMLGCDKHDRAATVGFFALTFVLGCLFLTVELNELIRLIDEQAGPDRSAFLSAFFTLVGTHGLHICAGLLWLAVLGVQLSRKGFSETMVRRFFCFSLFWHVLDMVWIGLFTFVYLIGAQP